jgi:hypothetical protein
VAGFRTLWVYLDLNLNPDFTGLAFHWVCKDREMKLLITGGKWIWLLIAITLCGLLLAIFLPIRLSKP